MQPYEIARAIFWTWPLALGLFVLIGTILFRRARRGTLRVRWEWFWMAFGYAIFAYVIAWSVNIWLQASEF